MPLTERQQLEQDASPYYCLGFIVSSLARAEECLHATDIPGAQSALQTACDAYTRFNAARKKLQWEKDAGFVAGYEAVHGPLPEVKQP